MAGAGREESIEPGWGEPDSSRPFHLYPAHLKEVALGEVWHGVPDQEEKGPISDLHGARRQPKGPFRTEKTLDTKHAPKTTMETNDVLLKLEKDRNQS